MMPRVPLPVTAALVVALEKEGDLFACAERLLALRDEPDLAPARALILDCLAPLIDMGAVQENQGQRHVDRSALLRFGVGVMGLREHALWDMSLEALAAAYTHWRAGMVVDDSVNPPAAAFLKEMAVRFPDTAQNK